jgi:DNA (cytosine-5)-methyltransferase 1
LEKIAMVKANTKKGYEEAENGDSINFSYPNSKTRRGRVGKQVAQTLTASSLSPQGVLMIQGDDVRVRRYTPKECFRLMGFDDEDVDVLIENGISNTQLYKMAGNSIVVNVLDEIFDRLFKSSWF